MLFGFRLAKIQCQISNFANNRANLWNKIWLAITTRILKTKNGLKFVTEVEMFHEEISRAIEDNKTELIIGDLQTV